MAAPDPLAVRRRAFALVSAVGDEAAAALRDNPFDAVFNYFGLSVVERTSSGCDLDASYDRLNRRITIASDASAGRKRFSCIHELGHHLVAEDNDINDWLFDLGAQHHATAEEALVDAFAAEILLPADLVAQELPATFGARELSRFVSTHPVASREACVVAAAARLDRSGLIALAVGPVVRFSSPKNLPLRIGRGVIQPERSSISRAQRDLMTRIDREPVMLRSGWTTTSFDGDAIVGDDDYTYVVLRESAPDIDPQGHTTTARWNCRQCGEDLTGGDWCDSCNRTICETCGCGCPPRPAATRQARVCPECYLQIPPASTTCPNCS